MRTFATLKNFTRSEAKDTIVRNLNRIMDIAIVDIDIEHGTLTLLHSGQQVLEKAKKKELRCIGFPINSLRVQKRAKLPGNCPNAFG